jgi:hypothetical protein
MEPPKAAVPVGVVRERVIQTLSEAFANDQLSVAELEDRLEKVYRATNAEEAMALIAGLPSSAAVAAARHAELAETSVRTRPERFRSFFSSQSRRGIWTVPRAMDVTAMFSDTTIDLTHAHLPSDIIDLHVSVMFANMTIVIPPGLRVVNRVGAFAASVSSEPALDLAPMKPGSPVVRITGNCMFANLEIVSGVRPGE